VSHEGTKTVIFVAFVADLFVSLAAAQSSSEQVFKNI